MASRILTRTSVALQRADCLHSASASALVPFRRRRKWKRTAVSAFSPAGTEEGGAMPGDADVAADHGV